MLFTFDRIDPYPDFQVSTIFELQIDFRSDVMLLYFYLCCLNVCIKLQDHQGSLFLCCFYVVFMLFSSVILTSLASGLTQAIQVAKSENAEFAQSLSTNDLNNINNRG